MVCTRTVLLLFSVNWFSHRGDNLFLLQNLICFPYNYFFSAHTIRNDFFFVVLRIILEFIWFSSFLFKTFATWITQFLMRDTFRLPSQHWKLSSVQWDFFTFHDYNIRFIYILILFQKCSPQFIFKLYNKTLKRVKYSICLPNN